MSSASVAVLPSIGDNASEIPTIHAAKQLAPRTQTVIVFDWDDTLLASSWLASHGLRLDDSDNIPDEFRKLLKLLSQAVVRLLQRASLFGEVVIITNAQTGWVERSAEKFIPDVLPHVRKLRVLSARSEFESEFPNQPLAWKVQAFHQEIFSAYAQAGSDVHRNVISLGDSRHERVAIHRVTTSLPNALTKSIKFVDHPSIEQLTRQVDLVNQCMEEIVHHKGNLDLMLTIQVLT